MHRGQAGMYIERRQAYPRHGANTTGERSWSHRGLWQAAPMPGTEAGPGQQIRAENLMMAGYNVVAWGLALAGGLCTIIAAYLAGGKVAAWGASGAALTGAAGVLGWTARPK